MIDQKPGGRSGFLSLQAPVLSGSDAPMYLKYARPAYDSVIQIAS